MTKNKGYHFSKKISNLKKKKKKKLFQWTTRINQRFPSKGEIQVKEKKERKITNLKIVEQQSTHHLKSNPKLVFCRQNPQVPR